MVVKRRIYLRNLNETSPLFETLIPSEKTIVQYNLKHKIWLEHFKYSYKHLEKSTFLFLNKEISDDDFKNIVLESASKDEFQRPFWR
jgi:hypothetical protein